MNQIVRVVMDYLFSLFGVRRTLEVSLLRISSPAPAPSSEDESGFMRALNSSLLRLRALRERSAFTALRNLQSRWKWWKSEIYVHL